jgi:ubiquinone biosynthesis protein
MVATLKPAHLNFLASFALSAYRNDSKSLAKALVTLAEIKFFKDFDNLEFELDQLLKSYLYLPFDKLDFSKIIQECINLMIKYKLQIPSSIYMLAKTLATIQKFAGDLHPNLNLGPVILPYAKRLLLKRFDPKKMVSNIYDTITQYVHLVGELPDQINEVLHNMKQGKLKIEMNINEQESFGKVVRHFGQRLSIAIILTCLGAISTALLIFRPELQIGQYAFGITLTLMFVVLVKYVFNFK